MLESTDSWVDSWLMDPAPLESTHACVELTQSFGSRKHEILSRNNQDQKGGANQSMSATGESKAPTHGPDTPCTVHAASHEREREVVSDADSGVPSGDEAARTEGDGGEECEQEWDDELDADYEPTDEEMWAHGERVREHCGRRMM